MRDVGARARRLRKRGWRGLALWKRDDRERAHAKHDRARRADRILLRTARDLEPDVGVQVEDGQARTAVVEELRAHEQMAQRDRRITFENDVALVVTPDDHERVVVDGDIEVSEIVRREPVEPVAGPEHVTCVRGEREAIRDVRARVLQRDRNVRRQACRGVALRHLTYDMTFACSRPRHKRRSRCDAPDAAR